MNDDRCRAIESQVEQIFVDHTSCATKGKKKSLSKKKPEERLRLTRVFVKLMAEVVFLSPVS